MRRRRWRTAAENLGAVKRRLPVASDRAVTTRDVARRLGVSVDKVRAWIASGELRAIDVALRRGGRPRWRITAEDLDAFLVSRSVAPVPVVRRRFERSHASSSAAIG
ncbi:MAG: helix-turn-helix domain-containing protein [Gemmataceae bacterium]